MFARSKRQVFLDQILQIMLCYQILGLITVAHHSIVLACTQILHRLGQVIHYHQLGADLLQSVAHGTTGHQRHLQIVHVAQSVALLSAFTSYDLIVQSYHSTRIVGQVLAVWRIYHHTQVYPALQHVAGYCAPCVGFVLKWDIQTLHQQFGTLHVGSAGHPLLVHKLQWRVVLVDTELQWFLFAEAKIVSTCRNGKCHH